MKNIYRSFGNIMSFERKTLALWRYLGRLYLHLLIGGINKYISSTNIGFPPSIIYV